MLLICELDPIERTTAWYTSSSNEPVRPVDLKFCVDVEFVESSIALGFITKTGSYEKLTDEQVRDFLSKRAEESKSWTTS